MRAKQGTDDEIKIDRSQVRPGGTSKDDSKTLDISTWASLIRRVYESGPLTCPRRGSKT